ncbi:unnamed protein product [Schistosoma mattheei]|uniref:Uncharacterized protein n=1 Tax=Schistosoma mattheei TaxID=31246 RepID=A0A183NM59_9TREM|nr:unnamed protein product [Schistosoma mattheei]
MVEPTGTYVPANIALLGQYNRPARPPHQGSSYGREADQYTETNSKERHRPIHLALRQNNSTKQIKSFL